MDLIHHLSNVCQLILLHSPIGALLQATQVEFTTNGYGGNDFFDISLVVSGPFLLRMNCHSALTVSSTCTAELSYNQPLQSSHWALRCRMPTTLACSSSLPAAAKLPDAASPICSHSASLQTSMATGIASTQLDLASSPLPPRSSSSQHAQMLTPTPRTTPPARSPAQLVSTTR